MSINTFRNRCTNLQTGYEDIIELVTKKFGISREEFQKRVNELLAKYENFISPRAAAIMVAKEFGVSPFTIVNPPIIGRLIEVGPVRYTKSTPPTPYVLFAVVDTSQRYSCVAFGEKHVNLLRDPTNDDRVIRIRGYTKAKFRMGRLIKVTETSEIELLGDDTLPPILKLKPAWADSLLDLKQKRGTYISQALVIEETKTEYFVCPICGKTLEFQDSDLVCPEHGIVEPKTAVVKRLIISDKTLTAPAVYFGKTFDEELINKAITFKGYFKEDELQILKIYNIYEIT